jgi:hypothetical protein
LQAYIITLPPLPSEAGRARRRVRVYDEVTEAPAEA